MTIAIRQPEGCHTETVHLIAMTATWDTIQFIFRIQQFKGSQVDDCLE